MKGILIIMHTYRVKKNILGKILRWWWGVYMFGVPEHQPWVVAGPIALTLSHAETMESGSILSLREFGFGDIQTVRN